MSTFMTRFIVLKLAVLGVAATAACKSAQQESEQFHFPSPAAMDEQYLPDGSVPPPRERYSLPSVRQMPTEALWQLIAESSDGMVIVGLKDRHPRGYFRGKVLVEPDRIQQIRSALLASLRLTVPRGEVRQPPAIGEGRRLPAFVARLESPEQLASLRRSLNVDYVEPRFFFMESSACTQNPYQAKAIGSNDGQFTDGRTGSGGLPLVSDLVPYPLHHMGVVEAWRVTLAGTGFGFGYPGANAGIAVLDSGTSPNQRQLNEDFRGDSARPPAVHMTAAGIGAGDTCGHGTRIAGVAAAPRDGVSIIGVAWGAPLTTVKVDDNPIVTGGPHNVDVFNICDGIAKAMSSSARVVSMAFGLSYTSPTIEECIRDAYDTHPRAIFVAAAGTTFSWVVFPAVMNREVLAVSLVEINTQGGYKMLPFMQVAYGPDVDFVTPITTDDVAATGLFTTQVWSLGGSSAATALFSGLTSIVWSRFPDKSRDEIIDLIKRSSSIAGITDQGGLPPFSQVGAGVPNAYLAMGGCTRLEISGPTEGAPGSMIQLRAMPNCPRQLVYTWSRGLGSGPTASLTLPPIVGSRETVSVTAGDPVAGVNLSASQTIEVKMALSPPTTVTLFSAETVLEYPVFLDGNRVDRTLNGGVLMPLGCAVSALQGVRICKGGGSEAWSVCSGIAAAQSRGDAWGFTVSLDPAASLRDLTANVHVWHDGITDIRVRAVYTVSQPAGVDCSVPGKTQQTPF